jgi:hypothetical protein
VGAKYQITKPEISQLVEYVVRIIKEEHEQKLAQQQKEVVA